MMSTTVFAGHPKDEGGKRHGPMDAEHQLARLDKTLDLSDEQSAELLPVLQAAQAEREALHERFMAEFKPELCAHMQATHEEILTVLTADQATQFDELMAERKGRWSGRGGHDGMPALDCD
jgi:Spy/CpxP family protein refolding chaperone